jgi:hypothetical protein
LFSAPANAVAKRLQFRRASEIAENPYFKLFMSIRNPVSFDLHAAHVMKIVVRVKCASPLIIPVWLGILTSGSSKFPELVVYKLRASLNARLPIG